MFLSKVFIYFEMYGLLYLYLYFFVFRYFILLFVIFIRYKGELFKILVKIDEYQIMLLFGVVQLLSRNGVVDVGSVKEWLRGKVEENEEEIEFVSGIIGFYILIIEYLQRLQDKYFYDFYCLEIVVKCKVILDRSSVFQLEVF